MLLLAVAALFYLQLQTVAQRQIFQQWQHGAKFVPLDFLEDGKLYADARNLVRVLKLFLVHRQAAFVETAFFEMPDMLRVHIPSQFHRRSRESTEHEQYVSEQFFHE